MRFHLVRPRAAIVLAAFVASAALALPGSSALAQAGTVSLQASERHVTFGRSVLLSGTVVDPTAMGQTIEITDAAGRVVADAVVDDQGDFQTRFAPRKRTELQAHWGADASDVVVVNVRPVSSVKLKPARLFDRAKVTGVIRPVMARESATLTLQRNGRRVARRSVRLGSSPRFTSSFSIPKPGRYRVSVHVDPAEHLSARARSGSIMPELPSLSPGSRSRAVKLLERRLIGLGYYLPRADRIYDNETYDAVIAFNKVQRSARVGYVKARTWRALASPIVPRPRVRRGYHIEIDQTRQVLFVVSKQKVRWILHTSTGAGGITRDGDWRVHRKLAGTSGGGLYYPSYFDGLRAIHGWPEVPTYPASHGCARVPMWSAQWIYSKSEIGTRVLVYH